MAQVVKAVAVDIDGTLTDEKRRISLAAIKALRRAEARGVKVILCSGNVLPIAYGIATMLGAAGPVVAENGGVVMRGDTVHLLRDIKDPKRALKKLEKEMGVRQRRTNRWRETSVAIDTGYDITRVNEIIAPFGVEAVDTGWAIQIFRTGTGKAEGLKKAVELLGLERENIMAIGDNYNDMGMLEYAGIGVAVANAPREVKEAADHVTRSENGKGVEEALALYMDEV